MHLRAVSLDRALAARYQELWDVKVWGVVLMNRPNIPSGPDIAVHFTWNSWYMDGLERKKIDEEIAYHILLRYSELLQHYRGKCGTDSCGDDTGVSYG